MNLIWKDWRSARSLVLVAIGCLIVIFAMQLFLSTASRPNIDGYFITWTSASMIAALGLPLMVIGGENDERTYDWLRTLPVSWKRVLLSKVLVCLMGWLTVLAAATLGLWICDVYLERTIDARIFADNLSWDKKLSPVVVGLALLTTGAIASFLVRIPLLAAALVFPLMYLMATVVASIAESSLWRSAIREPLGLSRQVEAGVLFAGAACVFVIGLILVARRRLLGPSDEPWVRWQFPRLRSGPSKQTMLASIRPSIFKTLLWQSARQVRWMAVGALVSSTVVMVTQRTGFQSMMAPLLLIFFHIVHLFLGVSAFSGERKRPRVGFFADRGVSPTLVWWTRLVPSLLVSVVIAIGVFVWDQYHSTGNPPGPMSLAFQPNPFLLIFGSQLLAFWIGVSVGQWQTKPTFAYCVSPMIASAWMSPVCLFLLRLYPDQAWMLFPAMAVWIFASWRLTTMVMEGRSGPKVWGRGVGYAMMAMLVVFAGVGVHLYATIPPAMPDWRSGLLAQRVAFPDVDAQRKLTDDRGDFFYFKQKLRRSFGAHRYDYQPDFSDWTPDQFRESTYDQVRQLPRFIRVYPSSAIGDADALRREAEVSFVLSMADLDPDLPMRILARVSPRMLISSLLPEQTEIVPGMVFNSAVGELIRQEDARKLRYVAIESALQWASSVRADVVETGDLSELLLVGETCERLAIHGLQNIAKEQGLFRDDPAVEAVDSDPRELAEFRRLVELIPSAELRRQSRRLSLILEWQRCQNLGTGFGSMSFGEPRYELAFERKRARRLIDAGTRLTLSQLDGELPSVKDYAFWEQLEVWEHLFFPGGTFPRSSQADSGIWSIYPVFVIEHEQLISRLKSAAK